MGSIHTFHSRSGARGFPRVDYQALIQIQQGSFVTREWSGGGFSLYDQELPSGVGSTYDGSICFDMPVGKFAIPVRFKVVRVSDDGFALGCQFTDMEPGHAKVLQAIVDNFLLGETTSIENLASLGVKAQLHKEELQRIHLNWWRFGLAASLAICVLSLAALMVESRLLNIVSQHAAVSQPVLNQRSNGNGVLALGNFEIGQQVSKGELLFSVLTKDGVDLLANDELELNDLDTRITYYQSLLAQSEQAISRYGTRLVLEQAVLADKQELMREELATRERLLKLYDKAVIQGSIEAIARERERLETLQLGRSLLSMDAEKEEIQSQIDQIAIGVPPREAESGLQSPYEAQRQLDMLFSQRERLLVEVERLKVRGLAYSPCDCYVVSINAPDGQVVQTGTSIVELSRFSESDRDGRSVIALMPLKKAELLKTGMSVDYQLASRDSYSSGTIEEIRFYSAANAEVYNKQGELLGGLPQTLPRLKQYTLIKIAPSELDDLPVVNEPVKVVVPVSFGALFKNWFNL